MKNIYFIILATFLLTSTLNAQNSFIGTWEYQTGNEIFRVILWLDENGEDIKGHYEKVTINNGVETYIYCSDKEKFQGNNKGWSPYVINTNGNDIIIGGTFIDNTVNANLYHPLKLGSVKIEVVNNNGTDPITAQWNVKRGQGPKINEAPEFSVPTDIILTKVK